MVVKLQEKPPASKPNIKQANPKQKISMRVANTKLSGNLGSQEVLRDIAKD